MERAASRASGRTIAATALAAVALVAGASLAGCDLVGRRAPPKSPETRAVEAKAGDFADYWAEVLRLSRRHAAHPDSFRAALDALPGSHLTDAEWKAWVAPYRNDAVRLASKLEEAIATVAPAD